MTTLLQKPEGDAGKLFESIFGIRWPYGAQAMALRTLSDLSIAVREDGTWYVVLPYVELRQKGLLSTPTQKAPDPAMAIYRAWEQYADPKAVVVVSRPGMPKRVVRWNLFMWQDLDPNAGGAEEAKP